MAANMVVDGDLRPPVHVIGGVEKEDGKGPCQNGLVKVHGEERAHDGP
jgi:hypothetical protein